MESDVDVVVVGCGGAGSAAAWRLAQRGRAVIALDRFEPGHQRGSSHGTERIVRAAYADRVYAEMAVTALDQWRELESVRGVELLTITGGIDFGDEDELEQIARTSATIGVATEWLDGAEARRRFAGIAAEGPVLLSPGAGTVRADRAVAAMREAALAAGAELSFDERVIAIEPDRDRVVVRTDARRVRAATCVVTAGAWAAQILADAGASIPPITVTKEQVAFFRRRDDTDAIHWPTFIDRGEPTVYGMRTPDGLIKAGEHHAGPVVDPDRRDFDVERTSWQRLIEWARHHLPGVDPTPVGDLTCLYASAPNEDFVIDRVGPVVFAAGLGGHGFKFLPEIGRRLADLVDGITAANPFALGSASRVDGGTRHK